MQISKGQNVSIEAPAVRVIVGWKDTEFAPEVQVSALLLCPQKVRSDDDFVTPESKVHRSGTVRYAGSATIDGVCTGNLLVALAGMDPAVQRIAVVGVAVDGYFGQLSGLYVQVVNAAGGAELARFDTRDAGRERVFVLGELYRRDIEWRFRAVGQGYRSGLAGLANDFGLTPREDSPTPPEPTLPKPDPPKKSESRSRPARPGSRPPPPGQFHPQPHPPQGYPPQSYPPQGPPPGRQGHPPPPGGYGPPGRYAPGVRPAGPPPGQPPVRRQPPPYPPPHPPQGPPSGRRP